MRGGRIDYRMARLATIRDVQEGMRTPADVRDAHPDLVRAGKHIGEVVAKGCPLCKKDDLRHVTYIFPTWGKTKNRGQAVPRASVGNFRKRFGDLAVYTVEVCIGCKWHHLVEKLDVAARPDRTA